MTHGNHASGSVMSVMTQKKAIPTGLRLHRRTKIRSLENKMKAHVKKLRAKVSKKRAQTERIKKSLNQTKAKVEEMDLECARMREENKLAIEENVYIQLSIDYVVLACLLIMLWQWWMLITATTP